MKLLAFIFEQPSYFDFLVFESQKSMHNEMVIIPNKRVVGEMQCLSVL